MPCKKDSAFCPKCSSDINFKKPGKDFCNCKKCDWECRVCEDQEVFQESPSEDQST